MNLFSDAWQNRLKQTSGPVVWMQRGSHPQIRSLNILTTLCFIWNYTNTSLNNELENAMSSTSTLASCNRLVHIKTGWHEYHVELFYCSVDHRRQLHNRRCMWLKSGGAQKPETLGVWKVGGLKPSSLIEVYAYVYDYRHSNYLSMSRTV